MKRVFFPIIAIFATIFLGHFVTKADSGSSQSGQDNFNSIQLASVPGKPSAKTPSYYDVLIEGIDRRPKQTAGGRSDVIMIIHCEPGHISFFSIPRDSLVQIGTKKDKINSSYAAGGIKASKGTIERFLKFKVDNYLVLDFKTFLETIDTIKTLTDDGRLIGAENFLMSGENLLKWLRWRHLPGGDIRRGQRHQLFMKRIFQYTQDMYNKQPALFSQCMKAGLKIAETDLTYDHIAALYETYKNFNIENDLERYVLPGYAESRYRENTTVHPDDYEEENTPDLGYIDIDPNLTPEQKEQKKKEMIRAFRKQNNLISYFIPKYDWSLVQYVHFYRSKGLKLNYKEEDTLRK